MKQIPSLTLHIIVVMQIKNISEIEKFTVALYREKFGSYSPMGSGILIALQDKHYLISAFHVFDLEEERLQIENDPDEKGIPHDDLEGIYAKGINEFFCINYDVKCLVFVTHYDEETKQPVFNEDMEWCVCRLSEEIASCLTETGKLFYIINEMKFPEVLTGSSMIVSGYPRYAQKENLAQYRSYRAQALSNSEISNSDLVRVMFDNSNAFNYEHNRIVKLPRDGIAGMSGGGIWAEKDDKYIPIGIILKQESDYIEGFRLDSILYNNRNKLNIIL